MTSAALKASSAVLSMSDVRPQATPSKISTAHATSGRRAIAAGSSLAGQVLASARHRRFVKHARHGANLGCALQQLQPFTAAHNSAKKGRGRCRPTARIRCVALTRQLPCCCEHKS